MSNQFAAKAFPVIGKARKTLVGRGFSVDAANAVINAQGTTLGAQFSTACKLLRNPA